MAFRFDIYFWKSLRRQFEEARERVRSVHPYFPAGARPYCLQYSWCSRVLDEVRQSLVVVASVSRHDIKIRLDYYAHPDYACQRRLEDAIDDFNA